MVRLKDVAQAAGVSVMTVSKVLRDAPDISTATKTRIRMLAQQMGYMPDSMAQSLRTRRTKLFGLIISAVTNPIFSRMVLALEERAHELGYDLLMGHSLNDPAREEAVIRRMLSRRIDGLFISPVYRLSATAPIYAELAERKTPVVLLGPRASFCAQFPSVETDDLTSSLEATRRLIQLGHRRIAFFAGSVAAPWAQERFEGYRRALREAQVEDDDKLVFNAGAGIEDGEKAALQMLNEGIRPTAILAVNDLVAIGLATVLLNQGWKIPEDISVVGFGNVLTSEYFRVPLTTVRQPKYRLGVTAMELMQKIIKGEPVEPKRLSAELIVRASTAPPRAEI